jgi:glutamyl-tRNA reductase
MITLKGKDLEFSLAEREAYVRVLQPQSLSHVSLITCNRVELYEGAGAVPIPVARHLFRVVSGLESALLGETAVQGQVKQAYDEALIRPLSTELHHLFQNALRVGKLVRTETKISQGAMSHGNAVVEIITRLNINLTQARILIIGVNALNYKVLRYLHKKGAQTIFIANRSYAKAVALSQTFGGAAFTLDCLPALLPQVDIVISATSAPHQIISAKQFTARQPIVVFDLAVPRDIDPHIGRLDNVCLYNNEDIERIISKNRHVRQKELTIAEEIIHGEVAGLYGY